MKHFNNFALIILLFHLVLFLSCKKDLALDNANKKFPIELKIDTTTTPFILSWDKANNSNFRSYIIVRSTDTIPSGLVPQIGSSQFKIIAYINERDSLQFSDYSAPFSSVLHYKLYIDIGNRYIESPELVYNQGLFFFQTNYVTIGMDEDSSWAYISETSNHKLIVFDYSINKILYENSNSPIFNNPRYICTGYDGKTKSLFIDNSNLYKLNFPSLDVVNTQSSFNVCYSLISNKNGLLFSRYYDKVNSFVVRKQTDGSILNSVSMSDYYPGSTLYLLNADSNKVLEIAYRYIKTFYVNQITGSIYNIDSIPTFKTNYLFHQVVVSKDHRYFLPFANCYIYDNYLKLIAHNNISPNIDYTFSDDIKFLYAASTDANNISTITKFSFPELEYIKEIVIPSVKIYRIKSYNNSIVIFGNDLNLNRFFVRKVMII